MYLYCMWCWSAGEVKVDADWPSDGEIVFNNVSIRYSGNACPVARNLNIHIQPGEKVWQQHLMSRLITLHWLHIGGLPIGLTKR